MPVAFLRKDSRRLFGLGVYNICMAVLELPLCKMSNVCSRRQNNGCLLFANLLTGIYRFGSPEARSGVGLHEGRVLGGFGIREEGRVETRHHCWLFE